MNTEKEINATKTQETNSHRDMVVIVRVESAKSIGLGYMIARRGDNNRLYFLAEDEARALASGELVKRDEYGRAVCGLFTALEIGEKYATIAGLRKCRAIKQWSAGAANQNKARAKHKRSIAASQSVASKAQADLLAAMLAGKDTSDLLAAFRSATEHAQKIKAGTAPKVAHIDRLERDLAALLWSPQFSGADLWEEDGCADGVTLSAACKSGAQVWKSAEQQREKTRENLRKANEKERKSIDRKAKAVQAKSDERERAKRRAE